MRGLDSLKLRRSGYSVIRLINRIRDVSWFSPGGGATPESRSGLHRGLVIVARAPGRSQEIPIDFAQVLIERDGLWKVYAYED